MIVFNCAHLAGTDSAISYNNKRAYINCEDNLMTWLAQNWFWVLLFAIFITMHLFGHGHGGHSGGGGCGHGKHKHPDKNDQNPTEKTPPGHQH